MSGTDDGRKQIEERLREGFATFRPSEPDAGRYEDLKRAAEFTLEGLRADPWEVVNKAVPEAPSDELLEAARHAARRCAEEAFEKLQTDPLGNLAGMDQDYEGARARQAELDETAHWRAIAGAPVTLEAIERDPWNAVVYGLPQDGSAQLYATVAETARYLLYGRDPPPPFTVTDDGNWPGLGSQIKERWQEAAELGAAAEQREQAAMIETRAPYGNFLSLEYAMRQVGERLSRTVEMVLDTFFDFFVSEPKLTTQQVHEHLQAAGNVETLHARDLAAAARAHEAAHDWQSVMTINHQQEKDLRLAQSIGTPATAEASLNRDEYEPQRERDRSRSL